MGNPSEGGRTAPYYLGGRLAVKFTDVLWPNEPFTARGITRVVAPRAARRAPRSVVADVGGRSQLSRRVSSDMALTVANSCTTPRLASTLSGVSPASGTSFRYFASTSAHLIPRGADP